MANSKARKGQEGLADRISRRKRGTRKQERSRRNEKRSRTSGPASHSVRNNERYTEKKKGKSPEAKDRRDNLRKAD